MGATIDVEQNHVRFLGDLILNLWDCGGQDAFMDCYLSAQRSTIFSHVGVMIYVFDVESREMAKDLEYYHECLDGLSQFSKDANVFLLVHKMDLIRDGERSATLQRKVGELEKASGDVPVKVHGTSIYDETLYKVRLFLPITSTRRADMKPGGLVQYSKHVDTKCAHTLQTPWNIRRGLQRNRGHLIRTHYFPCHCDFLM